MNKNKIYVPGMISLLLLFPVFVYQLLQWRIFEKQYVMELSCYSPAVPGLYGQEFPPQKHYTVISMTGNAADDDAKIRYAELLLTEMMEKHDRTGGVRIHFADTVKYESFVAVLDFCNQHDSLTYLPYQSDIWIFNRSRPKQQVKNMWLGSCLPGRLYADEEDVARKYAYTLGKRCWPIAVLFVFLAILNFSYFRQR